jgi:hypothetical protein
MESVLGFLKVVTALATLVLAAVTCWHVNVNKKTLQR